ncbi:MAG: ATP synthase F1 subunit delta [Myxococcales bacterium]|nr:ATP synthase F1 subunit delta [Myxococcales bacterium]
MSALGRRYARALLDVGRQADALDGYASQLQALLGAWTESEELRSVFENPEFSPEERRKVVDGLAARLGFAKPITGTLKLLSDRQRMRQLPDVIEAFTNLAEEAKGRVRADVVTATAMPEDYYARLKDALQSVTGREVVLHHRQDPTLIAGVVARVGDTVFDGSLKNRLDELKEELLAE